MFSFFKKQKEHILPPKEAIREALNHPNGWVYVIDDSFDTQEATPPQAIKGCWKVNEKGIIIGDFIPNPNYLDLTNLK
jgi:hypothetical protein